MLIWKVKELDVEELEAGMILVGLNSDSTRSTWMTNYGEAEADFLEKFTYAAPDAEAKMMTLADRMIPLNDSSPDYTVIGTIVSKPSPGNTLAGISAIAVIYIPANPTLNQRRGLPENAPLTIYRPIEGASLRLLHVLVSEDI